MKNTKRILIAVLALVMVLSVMLTGCKRPQVTFNKIPQVAATYGNGQELTSGQYLAYLAMATDEIYQEKMYELNPYYSYGIGDKDPWAETYTYGDSSEKISLADYILRYTQDTIKRQLVLTQMMKDNGLKFNADDEAEFNTSIAGMKKDAFIDLGFNNDTYIYVLRNLQLNESSTFYGLYGKGGKRAIPEAELKEYFEKNYLSYKAFTIALTDSNGKELDKKGEAYQKIMDRMNKYMEIYEKEGYDAAYEAYEKEQTEINEIKKATTTTTTTSGTGTTTAGSTTAGSTTAGSTTAGSTTTTTTAGSTTTGSETTTTTGSETTTTTGAAKEEEHDHDHRVNEDSSTMDEEVKKAIESVEVGSCKIVELTSASTPYVALIERLDIHKDDEGKEGTIYEDAIEDIIYTLKYEAFSKEVDALVAEFKITFNEKVINHKDCQPAKIYELMTSLFY